MCQLNPKELANCHKCPRLVIHREAVAKKEIMRRKIYKEQTYWGKPVPGFGDLNAQILLLGLAPGAHGSNRTGRMFTGDASGDFLFPALYKAGLASQANSDNLDDGMQLYKLWITAAARCVPPANKLLRNELLNCQSWLEYDFNHLKKLKLVLVLGATAHDSYLELLKSQGNKIIKNKYKFAHGKVHYFANALPMLDSYHVSFQNTNTGKLTTQMFAELLSQALALV